MSSVKSLKRLLTQEGRQKMKEILKSQDARQVSFNTIPSLTSAITDTDFRDATLSILLVACSEGNLDQLKELILLGHDVNEMNKEGETPLISAVESDNLEIASFLLEQGADPDLCYPKTKITPLMAAAFAGHVRMLTLLLKYGAKISVAAASGNTVLHCAATNGHLECVKFIIESLEKGEIARKELINGDCKVSNVSQETLIALTNSSRENGGFISVKAFLNLQNEVEHDALMEACSNNHYDVVKYLLSKGANVNTFSNEFKESPLIIAAYKGYTNMAKLLIDHGADIEHRTDEMHTPLMEATIGGHLDTAKLLIESGANIESLPDCFESPLTIAANRGHIDLVALYISYGANIEAVTEEGYTPLMEACKEGFDQVAAYLLALGANVKSISIESQETALSIASSCGSEKLVNLLLQHGAEVDAGGITPLMEAAQEGHLPIVRLLLQYGADPNKISHPTHCQPRRLQPLTTSGETALHFAIENEHFTIAKDLLLCNNINVEQACDSGYTLLMKAAKTGRLKMVRLLIEIGKANVNAIHMERGKNALCLACAEGYYDVVNYLLAVGAKRDVLLKHNNNCYLEAVRSGNVQVIQLIQGQIPINYDILSQPLVNTDITDISYLTNNAADNNNKKTITSSSLLLDHQQQQEQHSDNQALFDMKESASQNMLSIATNGTLTSCLNNAAAATLLALEEQRKEFALSIISNSASSSSNSNTTDNASQCQSPPSIFIPLTFGVKQCSLLDDLYNMDDGIITSTLPLCLPSTFSSSSTCSSSNSSSTCNTITSSSSTTTTTSSLSTYCLQQQQQLVDKDIDDSSWLDKLLLITSDTVSAIALSKFSSTVPPALSLHLIRQLAEDLSTAQALLETTSVSTDKMEKMRRMYRINQALLSVQKLLSSSSNVMMDKTSCCSNNNKLQPTSEIISPSDDQTNSLTILPQLHSKSSTSTEEHQHQEEYANSLAQSEEQSEHNKEEFLFDVNSCLLSTNENALHLACAKNHIAAVAYLLSIGVNPEHRDKKNGTCLHVAVQCQHVEVVRLLLDHGVDIDSPTDKSKESALLIAASNNSLKIVEMLLERGANKEFRNAGDYTAMCLSASAGHIKIVKCLLHHGADVNSRFGSKLGITPLMLAAMSGRVDCVETLLDHGADINAQIDNNQNTALTLATFQDLPEVVRVLAKRGANLEHRYKAGLNPLMEAAEGGYTAVGRVLLDCGADVNPLPGGPTKAHPLTLAAEKGHLEFVSLLLKRGALVEAKNKRGATALFLAASGGHCECVDLLLRHNACADSTDNRQMCALIAAFRNGHVSVVKSLLNKVENLPSAHDLQKHQQQIIENANETLLIGLKHCRELIEKKREEKLHKADQCCNDLLEELAQEDINRRKRDELAAKKRDRKRMKKMLKRQEKDKKGQINGGAINGEGSLSIEECATQTPSTVSTIIDNCHEIGKENSITTSSLCTLSSSTPIVQEDLCDHVVTTSTIEMKDSLEDGHCEFRGSIDVDLDKLTHDLSTCQLDDELSMFDHSKSSKKKPLAKDVANEVHKSKKNSQNKSIKASTSPLTYNSTTSTTTTAPPSTAASSKLIGKKDLVTTVLPIPKQWIGRVIGQGGSTVNAIRTKTLASVEISSDKEVDCHGNRWVTLKGTESQVKLARELIQGLVDGTLTAKQVAETVIQATETIKPTPSTPLVTKKLICPPAPPPEGASSQILTNTNLLPSTSVWASSAKKSNITPTASGVSSTISEIIPTVSSNVLTVNSPTLECTTASPLCDSLTSTRKAAVVSPMLSHSIMSSLSPTDHHASEFLSTFSSETTPGLEEQLATTTTLIDTNDRHEQDKKQTPPQRSFCRAPGSDRPFNVRQRTTGGNNPSTPLATVNPFIPNATTDSPIIDHNSSTVLRRENKSDAFGLLRVDEAMDSHIGSIVTTSYEFGDKDLLSAASYTGPTISNINNTTLYHHHQSPIDESPFPELDLLDYSLFPSASSSSLCASGSFSPFRSGRTPPLIPPVHLTSYPFSQTQLPPPPTAAATCIQLPTWQMPYMRNPPVEPCTNTTATNRQYQQAPTMRVLPPPQSSCDPRILDHHHQQQQHMQFYPSQSNYVSNSALHYHDSLYPDHSALTSSAHLNPLAFASIVQRNLGSSPVNMPTATYSVTNPWQYILPTPR